jgi:glycosyltransferase involved in cell wall biosynthesis
MNILHIDSGADMRGGQRQVLHLIEGLRAIGHDNLLLARTGSPLFDEAQRRGIAVQAFSLRSVARESRGADVTHAHDARSHSAAALAAPPRLVVSRRVAFPVQRNPLSRWKYRRATHYIAVSRFVAGILRGAGVAPSRITVVYDGVPMLTPANGTDIVVPESRDPRKGMSLALEAVKLAGFDARVSRDLEQDLAHAALFLYLTHSEGLGSAVLLAMSAGVPVIASNVGGLPEIVEHERTGLLTGNSPHAIAAAVRRLMEDRGLAASMATQARCMVQQKFSVERMVTDTLAVYKAIS